MKLASFYTGDGIAYGVATIDGLIAVSDGFRQRFACLRDVLAGDATDGLRQDVESREPDHGLDTVRYALPIHNSDRIHCVGINCPKRYPLNNLAPPPHIILFAKMDGVLVAHEAPLRRLYDHE